MSENRKTTVELPVSMYRRLRRLAKARRVSLSALVREACENQFASASRKQRLAAVRRLGSMDLPVGTVEEMKRQFIPDAVELLP
ncbi:MAG: ribbon-helix-helix protein, CopG family [Planctomycetaceae bacterium]